MSLGQLRQLVNRYVAGEIDHAEFRRLFVGEFLAVRHEDALLNQWIGSIESACEDLDEGVCDAPDLRARLAGIVAPEPARQATEARSTVSVFVDLFRPFPDDPSVATAAHAVAAFRRTHELGAMNRLRGNVHLQARQAGGQ